MTKKKTKHAGKINRAPVPAKSNEKGLSESIIENISEGIMMLDPSGAINFINPACSAIVGYKSNEMIGKTWRDIILAADHPTFENHYQAWLNESRDQVEINVSRKDGTVITVLINGGPLYWRDFFSGIVMAITDISAVKQAQQKLEASEERYRYLVENIYDVLFSIGPNQKILYISPAVESVLGYSAEEMEHTELIEFLEEHDWWLLEKVFHEVGQGYPSSCEVRMVRKDGKYSWIHISIKPTRKKVKGVYAQGVLTDINHSKSLENQLAHILYVTSHDLKAPVRAISQLASWLSRDYGHSFDPDGRELMNLMVGRVKRLDNLLNGILEYVRIGRQNHKIKEIHFNDFLKQIIKDLVIPKHIHLHIQPDLPVFISDMNLMEKLFFHLLNNAIKFNDKPKGKIEVKCREDKKHWLFSISDNGPGIDPAYHDKIFQIFQTLQARDDSENVGIGLAIAQKIIDILGEKIWIESKPGQGSTFYFTMKK